jgi:hypothetical protein
MWYGKRMKFYWSFERVSLTVLKVFAAVAI